jgi:hypothetical protein
MATPTFANTTLEYFDGFDDCNQSQLTRLWAGELTNMQNNQNVYSFIAPANSTPSAGNGRNGSASLRITTNYSPLGWVGPSRATRAVGFAINATNFNGNGGTLPLSIVSFGDAGTLQLCLRVNADGTLSVCRGANNGAVVLGPSTQSLTINTWWFVEVSVTISPTAGAATVRVGGATWLSGTALNTRATANNSANCVIIGPCPSDGRAWQADYDDVYIDSAGNFAGDCRVETHLPTGNGASSTWTPSAGSNYSCVADNPSDDDTTFNVSGTVGNLDLYTYPALATTAGAVQAVMIAPVLRNTASGSAGITMTYRQGSTNYSGGVQSVGSQSYSNYPDIQGHDPSTGAAWTIAGVNSAQYGVNRSS